VIRPRNENQKTTETADAREFESNLYLGRGGPRGNCEKGKGEKVPKGKMLKKALCTESGAFKGRATDGHLRERSRYSGTYF